jgi:preprotein translocase subunit YajC
MTAAPSAVGPLVDAAASKGGSSSSILIFVVIGAAFYFLIYRPQQKKQRAAKALTNTFEVGDEVVTAGGIVGRVLDISDDRVTLETSVGASFVVLRPYVLRKLEPVVPPPDVVDGAADDDHDDPQPPSEPPPDAVEDGPDVADGSGAEESTPATKKPSTDDEPDDTGSDGPSII